MEARNLRASSSFTEENSSALWMSCYNTNECNRNITDSVVQSKMWSKWALERRHFCSSYNHTSKLCVISFFFSYKWGLCLASFCLGLSPLWKIPPVMCHLASCTSAGSIPLLVHSQPAVIKSALKVFRMGAKAKPLFPSDNHTIVFTWHWPSTGESHKSLKSNNHSVLLLVYLAKSESVKQDVVAALWSDADCACF